VTAPIIVYRPLLFLQPLTALGADDGAAVDVSCDMASVELAPDAGTIDVSNFCGNYTLPGEVTVGATFEVIINGDTDANWAALVGKTVRAELFDKATDNVAGGKFRKFDTVIPLNPALYGPTTPGEARQFSFDVAVLSEVEIDTVPA
jgi:hypothetical protein